MNYQLIIKVPISQIDDVAARQIANEMIKDFELPVDSTIKLQRLVENKEPIGIKI